MLVIYKFAFKHIYFLLLDVLIQILQHMETINMWLANAFHDKKSITIIVRIYDTITSNVNLVQYLNPNLLIQSQLIQSFTFVTEYAKFSDGECPGSTGIRLA